MAYINVVLLKALKYIVKIVGAGILVILARKQNWSKLWILNPAKTRATLLMLLYLNGIVQLKLFTPDILDIKAGLLNFTWSK